MNVSRTGRIRKRSSKLIDFEFPEEIDNVTKISKAPEISNGNSVDKKLNMTRDPLKFENHNPWSVENVSDFLKYCCPEPECDYSNQTLKVFTEHALENHTKAKVFFTAENVAEHFSLDRIIKNEDPKDFESSNYDLASEFPWEPNVKEAEEKLETTELIPKPKKSSRPKKQTWKSS